MILRTICTIGLFVCLYLTICSYKEYSNTEKFQRDHKYEYNRQILKFNKLWNDDQFQQKNSYNKKIGFQVNEKEGLLVLKTQGKSNEKYKNIAFQNLEIQAEDAQQIQSINLINQQSGAILIKSKYFTIIYSPQSNKICYQKIGISFNEESYFVDSSTLWVFSHPNNNIVLLRVFDCNNNQLIKTEKYPAEEKIQFISQLKSQNNAIIVKFLTFTRNYLQYQFDSKNIVLKSSKIIETHSFNYDQKQIKQIQVHLNRKIHDSESYNSLQSFLYKLTFGYFGKEAQIQVTRDFQSNYDLDVFDCDKSLILKLNEGRNQSSIISFGSVLIPTRTPVFISKSDQQKLIPFDEALNKSRTTDTMPSVDFKLYGIKSKNLQIMKGKTGLYRLLPDAKVHFMAFDSKFLTFYPKENVDQEEYYIVRTAKGGIAMKGNQIKGIFQQTPVENPNAIELKNGYVKDQIYHQQTTNGMEVMPGIFEAHTIHKGLFIYPRKNRIDLTTSLSGKSILSHFLSVKGGYEYSTSYIQNNQFWVFEHKTNHPPIITKYQLFLNSSAPKTLLSIKRTYDIPITGRITRVQKCIDYFYYFTYITGNSKYGVARIHHALMSNRQSLPDHKYSGMFQKMMILPNIQRNKNIKVTANEQQLLIAEMRVDQSSFGDWKQLELKHQYKILPIRVYSYNNQYFIFNLRVIMLNAFDNQINLAQHSIYLKILLLSTGTAVLFALGIVLASKNKMIPKSEKPAEQSVKLKQSPKKDKKE